ncbi:MAG: hypothetical protein II902_06325 [Selenomonadaceae bacterium]|nr:hypothetical protein [Selenomonadaceae bacterium]
MTAPKKISARPFSLSGVKNFQRRDRLPRRKKFLTAPKKISARPFSLSGVKKFSAASLQANVHSNPNRE